MSAALAMAETETKPDGAPAGAREAGAASEPAPRGPASIARLAGLPAGDQLKLLVLAGFGAGFASVAPGTFGTAVALVIHAALARVLDERLFLLPLAALFFAATWAWGGLAERVYGKKDPSQVVSDELVGYFIAAAFLEGALPGFWTRALGAFLVFRLFDIV
ncbi:MAG TPA: phosphatidylglycerophosphatase A, partial [Planctomycetota bacterium]|nr:phosphatidylglycerophosphatase A [Planctomycetota bacterium]